MSKILIIDDEEKIRTLINQTLTQKGYTTDIAENGAIALEKIKLNPYDLVLSDVNMPQMTGIEFLKASKTIKKNLPVIFITASDMDATLQESMQFGLDGYIEKPFNLNHLFELIEEKTKKTK